MRHKELENLPDAPSYQVQIRWGWWKHDHFHETYDAQISDLRDLDHCVNAFIEAVTRKYAEYDVWIGATTVTPLLKSAYVSSDVWQEDFRRHLSWRRHLRETGREFVDGSWNMERPPEDWTYE